MGQAQQRQKVLSDWRSAMQNNTRARHQWVKQSTRPAVPQMMDPDDDLLDDAVVLMASRQHWKGVWDGAQAQPLQSWT